MKIPTKRPTQFLVIAGLGFLLLLLLSEDDSRNTRVRVDVVGKDTSTAPVGAQVVVERKSGETVKMRFGKSHFDLLGPVEISPGVTEDRPLHRVYMDSGAPGDESSFVATLPRIVLLDEITGEETGFYLEAKEAVFPLSESIGGQARLESGALKTRRFRLVGQIHGTLSSRNGESATLTAEHLHVDGDVIRSPGLITLSNADAEIQGEGLSWDRQEGRLAFSGGAKVTSSGEEESTRSVQVKGPFVALLDDSGDMISVQATGSVRWTSGDVTVESQTLAWNIAADEAILEGECLLQSPGLRLPAQKIILHPEAQTFEIHALELHLSGEK